MGFCGTDISSEIISKVIAAGSLVCFDAFSEREPVPTSLENAASIIDGLIGQGPEIHHRTRRLRRIHHPLGQQNSGEIFFGVGIPRRTVPALPPNRPGTLQRSSRCGKTDRPVPQPRLLPKNISEPNFCSEVSWSVVINSTDGRDRMRSLSRRPPFSIICAKALKSSAVDTSPALPFSKTGGGGNLPVTG